MVFMSLSTGVRPCNVHRVPCAGTSRRTTRCNAEPTKEASSGEPASTSAPNADLAKDLNKGVKDIASTFAPRASTPTGKNPATIGSTLYNVFTYQAWIAAAFGGALSFNLLFPSDQPDIWRLMGMWSLWMFTVPSLRARECTAVEKDWLNLAFIAIPLINVTLPLVWKNFAFVYSSDVVALAAFYYWKVYLPTNQPELDA